MDLLTRIDNALFKPKPMETENQTQPVAPETAAQPVESSSETQAPVAPSQQDASLNCSECNGSGLKDNATRCPKCQGTGKATNEGSQYPEGTQLLTQDGTFNVVNGELIKQE